MPDPVITFSFGLPMVTPAHRSAPIVEAPLCTPDFEIPVTVAQLLDRYVGAYRGRDRSIIKRLAFWRERLGSLSLAEVTDEHVYQGLKHLRETPAVYFHGRDAAGKPILKPKGDRKPATINRYLAAIGGAFSWAIRERLVPRGWETPCRRGLRLPGENPGIVRFLEEDERPRLLETCKASKWPRLYAIVLMALTTGARRGELQALRWEHIDFKRAEARVLTSKNGDPKVLPLVPAVLAELQRFHELDRRERKLACPSTFIFRAGKKNVPTDFTPHWYAALAAAQVKSFRFHDLRHSCASYLAQAGAGLLEIADVLGHKQLTMTRRYSHLTTSTKKALVSRVLGDIA